MNTVHVNASRSYDVLVGSGLLDSIGTYVTQTCDSTKACIVSDSNVWPLYGNIVESSLIRSGLDTVHFIFPAGEESKNASTYLELLNHLAANHLTRTDVIIALGGGVVGDLAGFAASTYLRGIPFVQVPTTLLAAVDSSVGGKTAIDLPAGKNLVGAFCQPGLVLCDTDCLDTLPQDIFRDGCAEVIKYGILYDPELFHYLTQTGLDFDRKWVITRCVELKRNVVAEDEFDTGLRMKLNLGHTFGHGVESLSSYSVSHGSAVAIGMAIAARGAAAFDICTDSSKDEILGILQKFSLPLTCAFSPEELADAALSDKKRNGRTVNLILPCHIGNCIIHPMPVSEIQSFIEAGL